MTDNAYIGTREAVTQTTDFIELHILNDLSLHDQIDITKAYAKGGDYFASFACHVIDFPELVAREYLATKLSLDFINNLFTGTSRELSKHTDPEKQNNETLDYYNRELDPALNRDMESAAEAVTGQIPNPDEIKPSALSTQLLQTFSESLLDDIRATIEKRWSKLIGQSGEMDHKLRVLRAKLQQDLQIQLTGIQKRNNKELESETIKKGVDHTQEHLRKQKSIYDQYLVEVDDDIHRRSNAAANHKIPNTNSLDGPMENVRLAILERWDLQSLIMGQFLTFFCSAIGIGSLVWIVIKVLSLNSAPSPLELFLWKAAPWVCALIGVFLYTQVIYYFARLRHQKFLARVEEFIEAASNIVIGIPDASLNDDVLLSYTPSSIKGFIKSRLLLSIESMRRELFAYLQKQAKFDFALGQRLKKSLMRQRDLISQHLEDLGVREINSSQDQDFSTLFNISSSAYSYHLIEAELINKYYEACYPSDKGDLRTAAVENLLNDLGGFSRWRIEAPLSDREAILNENRNQKDFNKIVQEPVIVNKMFARNAVSNITKFLRENIPNQGLGADFDGYEGLDPDGLNYRMKCEILIHPTMKEQLDTYPTQMLDSYTKTKTYYNEILPKDRDCNTIDKLRPNSIYLYSVVYGLSPTVVQNIKRYTSPLERPKSRLDDLFPFGSEVLDFNEFNQPSSPYKRSIEDQSDNSSDSQTEESTENTTNTSQDQSGEDVL